MKRKITVLICFLILGAVGCIASLSREQRLEQDIKQLKSEPANVDLLKDAGFLCLNLGRYNDAVSYGDRLMKLSRGRKDSTYLRANAHILLGQSYIYLSMMRESIDNLEKGRALAESLKDYDLLSSVYNGLGIYYTQGRANPEQGIVNYNHALAYADSAGNEMKQVVALYNLGGLWLHRNNPEGSRYSLEAYRKATAIGDKELAFYACINLNGYGLIQKNPEMASEWLTKARQLIKDTGTEGGDTYLKVFEAMTAELAGGDSKKADQLYRECMDNIQDLFPPMKTNLCSQYGRFLLNQKRIPEGIRVLERGLKEAAATEMASDSVTLILNLAEACHLAGDNARSYRLMEQYREISDRIRKQDEARSYMEYSVKNDMYLNQLLLERQRTQLLSKERNLILVVGICLLLVVSCGLLIYFYRRKNKLYNSIVAQNRQTMERERILRERINESKSNDSGNEENSTTLEQRGGTGSEEGLNELADRFALMLIDQRLYENPDLSINTAAELLGTNRTYLSKAINRSTGHSFSEIVTQHRIRRATEILSDPSDDRPLKGVAAAVGFSSISAFYAAFRNQVGMTPTQYRKKSKECM